MTSPVNTTVPRTRDHHHHFVYQTPFHPRTSELNRLNLWHRWKDYTVADAYFDVSLEYTALRNACAVFDLSPMTKHLITGPDALAFLDRLVTRDVAKLKPGRVGYAVWCDDQGQVIDDGTIFHLTRVRTGCALRNGSSTGSRPLRWVSTSRSARRPTTSPASRSRDRRAAPC